MHTVASFRPSEENATLVTQSSCSMRDRSSWVAGSHNLNVLSLLAVASNFPSGEKARHSTSFVCPLRVAFS